MLHHLVEVVARVLGRRKRRDSRGILDREKRRETKSGGGLGLCFGLWVWGLEINQLLIKAIDFFILFYFLVRVSHPIKNEKMIYVRELWILSGPKRIASLWFFLAHFKHIIYHICREALHVVCLLKETDEVENEFFMLHSTIYAFNMDDMIAHNLWPIKCLNGYLSCRSS